MVQTLWKTVWQFLEKLYTELSYDSAIPCLDICPRALKTCSHKNLYTNVRSNTIHKSQMSIYC